MQRLRPNFLTSLLVLAATFQSSVPVGNEPRHHVKFQNQYVRVIDAVVPPGDATLFHTHSADNVPVAISGGRLKTETVGGEPRESTVATGSVSFAKASYTHRITNIGDTTLRFIDVEILATVASPVKETSQRQDAAQNLILENERVRILRIILQPGQATSLNMNRLPGLIVALSPGKASISSARPKPQTVEFAPGTFAWHNSTPNESIKNMGSTRLELIDIDLKH